VADKQKLALAMAERLAADLRADGVDEAIIAKDTSRSQQRLSTAPVLIIACLSMVDMDHYPDQRRQFAEHQMAVQSVAMAAQNLLLSAHSEGLGACWLCAPLFCQDTVRSVLDLPIDYEPQGAIVMGYPSETREKMRAPLAPKVTFL
jgi:F420 biosynthesis protein FbiB-like protein